MKHLLSLNTKYYFPLSFLLIGYISVAFYLGVFLHYDFLRSDVLGYWQDSLAWRTPFHLFHVPGYPFLIAILRSITLGIFSALSLMFGINLVTFLISAFLVYRIIQINGAHDELAVLGIFLFGLWPFVGLTYAVDPLADMPAIFLFLMGVYFLLTARRSSAALFLGFSMITHKVMWVFVVLLVLAEWVHYKNHMSKHALWFIVIMILPVGLLWFLGSFYHSSLTWLFSSNLNVELASRSKLLILDGVLGTLLESGLKGVVKGSLLAGFACISFITVYVSLRYRYVNFQYGLAISLTVFALFLVLNQSEIWAAMRFGRLLAIPLVLIANASPKFKNLTWRSPTMITMLALFFISQFVYSWYLAVVYFG